MVTIIINMGPGKRPRKRHRLAQAWVMLTLLVLASTITARVVLWSIAMAASRDGLPGGEITLPAYCILLVLFGYHARSWVDVVRKTAVRSLIAYQHRAFRPPARLIIEGANTNHAPAPFVHQRPQGALILLGVSW